MSMLLGDGLIHECFLSIKIMPKILKEVHLVRKFNLFLILLGSSGDAEKTDITTEQYIILLISAGVCTVVFIIVLAVLFIK